MKPLFFLIYLFLFLTGCAQSSSPGGSPSPSPAPPLGASVLKFSTSTGFHFGIVPAGNSVEQTVTITNTGSSSSNTLNFNTSSLTSNFSLSNNTCSILTSNGTCSFKITYSPISTGTHSGSVSITGSSNNVTYTFAVGGISSNLSDSTNVVSRLNDLANILLVEQQIDGAFADGVGFDMNTTLYAANTLVKAKQKSSYPLDIFGGAITLNLTLNYLQTTSEGGGGVRNINFSTDKNTVIPEWLRSLPAGGMRTRELFSAFPIIHNNITQVKNSTTSSSYSLLNDYLDSRRLTGNQKSMIAQYSYIFDKNRWNSFFGSGFVSSNLNEIIELNLKDLYLLFSTLIQENKTTELSELSNAVLYNFALTSSEIQTEHGVTLSYSTTEFVHSSFTTASVPHILADNINTCRQNAYTLLVLSLAYKHGNFSSGTKTDLLNSSIPYLWNNLKTNWVDDLGGDNRTNCLPLMALAAFHTDRSLVSAAQVNSLFSEVNSSIDTFQYDTANGGTPLIMIEAMESLYQTLNN